MHSNLESQIGEMLSAGSPVASENIQSRLRGIIVMAHANAQGRMAIATGNKSELAQGYCTLYGDMAGGYTPLGDLYKMQVYALADVFNKRALDLGLTAPISQSTLTKPPSAELAPDQKDEDSLPPYDVLDEILRLHIEQTMDADDIAREGFNRETVIDVLSALSEMNTSAGKCHPHPESPAKHSVRGGVVHWHLDMIGVIELEVHKNQIQHHQSWPTKSSTLQVIVLSICLIEMICVNQCVKSARN